MYHIIDGHWEYGADGGECTCGRYVFWSNGKLIDEFGSEECE